MQTAVYILFVIVLLSCGDAGKRKPSFELTDSTVKTSQVNTQPASTLNTEKSQTIINTGNITPAQLVTFASTLQGIPYRYGSTDPQQGFDCSGFITYVFNHFNISVPRSSVEYTSVNRPINLNEAKTGDLILFTGTDSAIKVVGHMGILVAQPGMPLSFLHATSGKAYGVTQTPLNTYYMGRYMKTLRIFHQNDK
ncbi:C40 family peptidase [Mucilaginibacter galii]|uniref:NlpC/P60 domain-containing protein n=1 Tax=Mucilaginibacter galii TaxID=2005073 RepID=A0A917J8I6_9SPHI|nr:C40 family peptidase [Mucilaginibacter galii]GGI50728.1 hypothetical protein GCM10011425_19400 [Mucilaginibacter galii]